MRETAVTREGKAPIILSKEATFAKCWNMTKVGKRNDVIPSQVSRPLELQLNHTPRAGSRKTTNAKSIGEEGEQHAFNASKELQPLKEQTYEESQSHIEGVQDGIGIVQSDSVCYMTIHGVFGFSGGILGGDFNSTLSSAERSGGTCYGSGVNALFSEFVFKVGLLDSGFIGPQFT
ncbi:hypothetical protein V6N13_114371 [Hibiscus sabdariffa]